MYPLVILCSILGLVALCVNIVRGDWTAVAFAPFYTFLIWILWRLARAGVYVSISGVQAMRIFSSSIVSWDELAGFDMRGRELILRVLLADDVPTGLHRGYVPGALTLWLREKSFDQLVDVLLRMHADNAS
jgi:hypothetical protein